MPQMHHHLSLAMVAAFVIGCGEPAPSPSPSSGHFMEIDTGATATRTITLTKGDRIDIRTGTEGEVLATVTIADGKDDAGAYTSDDGAVAIIAGNAKNALSSPNTEVTIGVDDAGKIVSLAYAVKPNGDSR